MRLDSKLIKQFNEDNYEKLFYDLVDKKTDKYTNMVKLPMGVDGNDYGNIHKNISIVSKSFCNKARKGNYIFSAFREIQIPKAPYTKFEFNEARDNGKLRTLAISTINDSIFQKMIYNVIYPFTEKKYKNIDNCIFGYRKGKSVKQAVELIQQYFNQGYTYGIDGDIEKYFDKINHNRLKFKIDRFYKNDPLIAKYLYRFMKVKRVSIENKCKATDYYRIKPKTEKRDIGIPQGGILSGLLANLYLYNFDNYVINKLSTKYDIKYIRYADDFILLCKDKSIIMELYNSIYTYFKREKLNLHKIDTSAIDNTLPNDNKTKAIDLDKKSFIEFLGFKISKQCLGVKNDNIKKFKKVICHIIDVGLKEKVDIDKINYRINSKIMGNWIYGQGMFIPCNKCGKPQKPQSWIGFFININDMRQLKILDNFIRRQIRHFWHIRYRSHLDKKHFRNIKIGRGYYNNNVESLFRVACYIKNYLNEHPNLSYCECESYEPEQIIFIS